MAKKSKKKAKKFAYGGGFFQDLFKNVNYDPIANYTQQQFINTRNSPNYLENPDTALATNNINRAYAKMNENNILTDALDFIGAQSLNMAVPQFQNSFNSMLNKKAFGSGIEAEGGESLELPGGELLKIEGNSHEQGGVQMPNFGNGTTYFSKRIKVQHKGKWKTLSKVREDRAKKDAKIEKKLSDAPTDSILKNTVKRRKELSDREKEVILLLQENIKNTIEEEDNIEKARFGAIESIFGPPPITEAEAEMQANQIIPFALRETQTPITLKLRGLDRTPIPPPISSYKKLAIENNKNDFLSKAKKGYKNFFKNAFFDTSSAATPTFGDVLGVYGNYFQAKKPLQLTLENRAQDTPNVNSFENYGKEGLKALQGAKDGMRNILDKNIQDLLLTTQTARKANNSGASSINTARALNLATEAAKNKALSDFYANFINQSVGLSQSEANALNLIDQRVMQGDEKRREADIQDRDNFYTELTKNKLKEGENYSKTGKILNELKARGVNEELLNSISDFIELNIKNGKFNVKDDIDLTPKITAEITEFEKKEGYLELNPPFTKEKWDKLSKEEKINKIRNR